MFDPERILGHLLRGSLRGAASSNMSWSAKAGLGMGVLGVAMAAFEHFSEQSDQGLSATGAPGNPVSPPPVPPPLPGSSAGSIPAAMVSSPASPPPVPPPIPAAEEASRSPVEPATLLIRAMISAANADGVIDAEERAYILHAAEESQLTDEDRTFLQHELDRPWSLRDIANHADTPDLRKQIYAASRMAITVDSESERRYLQALSVALYLTTAEVAQIEAQLGE